MSTRKRGGTKRDARNRPVSAILNDARAALRRVDKGIDALGGHDEQRQRDGLQDVVVYGRVVIATIQNLRRAPGFASWWGLVEPKLGSDPVYGFFKDMRDDIEHEGVFEVWTAPGVITSLEPTTSQWAHLAPPDTDQTSIRLDGHVEFRGPYGVHLVPLPDHLVTRTLTFMHPPLGHEHEDAGTTARAYHSLLRSAVLETRAWFGHMP